MAVNELTRTDGGENNSSYLAKLQFILCQLDNTFTPKNRRRYNIVTQIMSIKTHLISPACYAYLQGLECLSLPHVHTLRKLYSSFGLENDFCAYLTQGTSCFSSEEKKRTKYMLGSILHIKGESSMRQIWTLKTRQEQYLR